MARSFVGGESSHSILFDLWSPYFRVCGVEKLREVSLPTYIIGNRELERIQIDKVETRINIVFCAHR